MEFFICNKRKIAVRPTIHQNSSVSKALIGKILRSLILNLENYCIPYRHRLFCQTTKQPLNKFEPQKRLGLRPDPSCS